MMILNWLKTMHTCKYPGDIPPSRQSMHDLAKTFCVAQGMPDNGMPVEHVTKVFQSNPSKSQVRASLQIGIRRRSLQSIMKDLT